MGKSNLLELLESDREMIMAAIARDRSPAAVQAAVEKALDRVMLRHAEQCRDGAARDAAQLVLSALKSALPLVDSVGEVRRWQRSVDASGRRKPGAAAWVALIGGAVVALAALMGASFAGGGMLAAAKALAPFLLGMGGVFWAGTRLARPAKAGPSEDPGDVRDEFLVDADRLWHHLRRMMLVADQALDGARERAEAEALQAARTSDAAAPDQARVELFAGLLESLYAQDGADAREMAESIRFHLHGSNVEVVDYAPGRESWFEFLPAQKPGTLRPAMVSGGRLIKKGLAAA